MLFIMLREGIKPSAALQHFQLLLKRNAIKFVSIPQMEHQEVSTLTPVEKLLTVDRCWWCQFL